MTTIGLVCLLFISHAFADTSFRRFCNRPPNFGKGKYVEKDKKCTVTYNVVSKSESAAAEFCSLQHPYTPGSVTYTKDTTTCDIYGFLECGDEEQLIGETCFFYDVETPYAASLNLCKKLSRDYKYELHIVKSHFEQKWISTFFSHLDMMWVGNSDSDMDYLDVIRFDGKALSGMNGRFVPHVSPSFKSYVIITRKGSAARIRAGYLAPMDPQAYIPVLCSRPATPKDEYLSGLMTKYAEAGIHAANFPDQSNKLRAFSILRGLHAFEIEKDVFEAGTARLHKACSAFKHGYAASPFDFQKVDDFKKLLNNAKVNIVAVPGRRTTKVENYDSCTQKDSEFEMARRNWQFDLVAPDGSTYHRAATNASFWRRTFPDRTCGDMPRTAMAFTQEGMIDVPNIARLFVACTFGLAPKREGRPDEMCSLAGKLVGDKCQCNDPKMDITIQKELRRYPEDAQNEMGRKCVDCTGNRQYALLIIMEHTAETGRKHVRQVLEYLKWPLAYYQFSVRLYSWHDGRYDAIGSGFQPIPYTRTIDDYWFSTHTPDIELMRDFDGGGKRTNLANVIRNAAQDIATISAYNRPRVSICALICASCFVSGSSLRRCSSRTLSTPTDYAFNEEEVNISCQEKDSSSLDSSQPFERKMIALLVTDITTDMEEAKKEARKIVDKGDMEIMVYSENNVTQFDEFCTHGKAKLYQWYGWGSCSEMGTDLTQRMLRNICLK